MSKETIPNLFTPLQMRELQLQNRIIVSPMCQYSAINGVANDWHLMHIGNLSQSGAGMIIMEATAIEARGRISPYCLGIWTNEQTASLKRVVDFCKQHSNVTVALQIGHAGRKGSAAPPWQGGKPLDVADGGWQNVAPSAIPFNPGYLIPEELKKAAIQDMVNAFGEAAHRADKAGFDAIELHAAHGYLLHQFLSPLSNHREDEYGGSLENRMRLTLQAFQQMRAAWPSHKPLGVRLSATDWVKGGWSVEESIILSKELEQLGCDWIDVSSGGLVMDAKIEIKPGYQVPFAEQIKSQTTVPVMAVGLITEADQAEQIIAQNQADMVALARGFLFNPRWPWHAAEKLGYEIVYPNQYKRCKPTQ
jgi:2,4-dienoyl-CoA reductase-like NADH-dependent reductase (Old Yellow Enzyme family)